jgi:hypothetical protein
MGDSKQIGVAGKKAEEVAGKSEVNQVPAKVEEKLVEGRAAQSTTRSSAGRCLHGS